MTGNDSNRPQPKQPVSERAVTRISSVSRTTAIRPALALLASRALPTITATAATIATVLTAERALRRLTDKLPRKRKSRPSTWITSKRVTVITEWISSERRPRSR